MKKFFSLLCAVAIVLSANAAPQLSKQLAAQKAERAYAEKSRVEKKTVHAVQLNKLAPAKAAKPAAKAVRAPKAKKEATEVEIGQYTSKFYEADNDVYFVLVSADNLYKFAFDIVVADGLEDVELGHEYVFSDMLNEYTKVAYNDEQYGVQDARFTMSLNESNLPHIEAYVKDLTGAEFNLVYDEEPFVPTGDTIRHDFTATSKLSYLASYGEWSLRAADNTFELALDYYSSDAESPVGSFTEADFDMSYCHVDSILSAENSSRKGIISGSLEVTSSNDTTFLFASLLCDDGNVYEFNAFFAVPVKQGEASISATNLALDDSWYSYFGVIWAEASNDDYTVSLTLNAATGTLQAGTDFSGSIKNNATGVETDIYSGSITITNDGGIKIAGSVLCFDNIEYTLDLQYVLPEAKSQETITGAGRLYLGESQGSKYWQAAAVNADQSRYVSLLAFADDPAGSYAMADLYASYTYVGKFAAPADTTWYNVLDANISVAVNGENATITGTLLGQAENDEADVVEFTINLSLEIVDETGGGEEGNQYDAKDQAFKHMFAEYEVNTQYLAEDHVIYVSAKDAENNSIRLEFNMAADATELTPGVYPINDTYAANTVSVGAFEGQSIYGSFAGSVDDEDYYNIPLWFFAEGEVKVLENGVIQVLATNTWGAQIECQLGSWPEAIDNTEAAVKATKSIRNGQLVIIKNGVEYNAQGAIVR